MTLTALPSIIEYPCTLSPATSSGTSSYTLDADGEKLAWVLQAPKDCTINKVAFTTATVAQSPANGLKVSLQDLDSSGDPDGTADQFRNVPTAQVATDTAIVTGLLTSDGSDTGTKRSLTAGDLFAVVVEFSSFGAGDDVDIVGRFSGIFGIDDAREYGHYVDHFTSAAWTKKGGTELLNLAVQLSDSSWMYIPGCGHATAVAALNVASTSNPDEIGIKFSLPFPARCVGVGGQFGIPASGAGTMHLYDANDTELGSVDFTDDATLAANRGIQRFYWVEGGISLAANTTYRVTFEATAAQNHATNKVTLASAAQGAAYPWGTGGVATERTDAGSWTDTTTRRYPFNILLDQIDDGVGGGQTVIIHRNYD